MAETAREKIHPLPLCDADTIDDAIAALLPEAPRKLEIRA